MEDYYFIFFIGNDTTSKLINNLVYVFHIDLRLIAIQPD
ncbi:hypothetical protein DSUL_30065 [Desulfovibrionales bacterium]